MPDISVPKDLGTHHGPASSGAQGWPPPGHCCWLTAAELQLLGPAAPPSAEDRGCLHGTVHTIRPGSRAPVGHRCSEPYLPCAAGLPQCLACGVFSSLNGLQDAAIGIRGFHGPLNEAVLIDAKDDAARREGGSWDMWLGVLENVRVYNLAGRPYLRVSYPFRSAHFCPNLGANLPMRLQNSWILRE